MGRPSVTRGQVAVPIFLTTGLAVGATAVGYYSGQALAYTSLIFGALFFAFAARYYIATVSVLLSPSVSLVNGRNGSKGEPNGNGSVGTPMVSVHVALYNEERVVDRLLTACTSLDYPNYEVVVVDDSDDGTVERLKDWILKQLKSDGTKLKIVHRENREGFKGGALNEALRRTSPQAEYVIVLDADFVPERDIIRKFLAYFGKHAPNGNGNGSSGRYGGGRLAAVQGYQWHTLNRTENWLTRGVSCEFSGSYMVDRTFQEVAGVMKMVAGSVYMVRADVLKELGWTGSITEDWELTLRLYEKGYKVLYTPLVQAPAECPSSLGKLIRQRMRWAEGHTYNVKKHFVSVLRSPKLGVREKLEFLYFAPYYLQSVFLILGTFAWLASDLLLGAKLPFLTAELGWGLVITNLLALPVMSLAGLFLEKRARRDFRGLVSQLVLIYALSPYQAFASLKGLIEPAEGSWIRTFKSGNVAGFPGRLEPRKVIKKVLPPKKMQAFPAPKAATVVLLGLSLIFATAFVQGQLSASQAPNPSYYFYDQSAPASYAPYSSSAGSSFLMHIPLPQGPDASAPIGNLQSSGLVFFSDSAPSDTLLPFGASISMHIWVNGTATRASNGTLGDLKFRIDIYDPANNSVSHIEGAGETEVFHLQQGVHLYQVSWGHIAQGKAVLKGETLVATIWCPNCDSPPALLFNSPSHPSNIDFPIEVPENAAGLAPLAVIVPGVAGIAVERMSSSDGDEGGEDRLSGKRKVQTYLIVAGALIFLTLPLVLSFNDLLATVASATGFDRAVSVVAPYEATAVADLLKGIGFAAGSSGNAVWISGGFIPVTALLDWNCVGWQSFFLFGVTSAVGLGEVNTNGGKFLVVLAGTAGIFVLNILRIFGVVLLGNCAGYPAALIFHDYGGAVMLLLFLFAFWALVLRGEGGSDG